MLEINEFTSEAKRIHACPTNSIDWPWRELCWDAHPPIVQLQPRIDLFNANARRYQAILQCQNRFNDTRNASRTFCVANIGLNTANLEIF